MAGYARVRRIDGGDEWVDPAVWSGSVVGRMVAVGEHTLYVAVLLGVPMLKTLTVVAGH